MSPRSIPARRRLIRVVRRKIFNAYFMANRVTLFTAVLGIVCSSCNRAPVKTSITLFSERSVHQQSKRVDETLSISLQDAFFVKLSQPVLRLSVVYHGNDLHSRYDTTISFRSACGEWLGNPSYLRFCNGGSMPSFLQNEHAFIWEMPAALPVDTRSVEVVFNSRSGSRGRRVIQFELPEPSKLPHDDIFRTKRIPPLSQKELKALNESQSTTNKTDAGNGSNGICHVSNVLRPPSPDPRRQASPIPPRS
jgi:hypothetical protein